MDRDYNEETREAQVFSTLTANLLCRLTKADVDSCLLIKDLPERDQDMAKAVGQAIKLDEDITELMVQIMFVLCRHFIIEHEIEANSPGYIRLIGGLSLLTALFEPGHIALSFAETERLLCQEGTIPVNTGPQPDKDEDGNIIEPEPSQYIKTERLRDVLRLTKRIIYNWEPNPFNDVHPSQGDGWDNLLSNAADTIAAIQRFQEIIHKRRARGNAPGDQPGPAVGRTNFEL